MKILSPFPSEVYSGCSRGRTRKRTEISLGSSFTAGEWRTPPPPEPTPLGEGIAAPELNHLTTRPSKSSFRFIRVFDETGESSLGFVPPYTGGLPSGSSSSPFQTRGNSNPGKGRSFRTFKHQACIPLQNTLLCLNATATPFSLSFFQ